MTCHTSASLVMTHLYSNSETYKFVSRKCVKVCAEINGDSYVSCCILIVIKTSRNFKIDSFRIHICHTLLMLDINF